MLLKLTLLERLIQLSLGDSDTLLGFPVCGSICLLLLRLWLQGLEVLNGRAIKRALLLCVRSHDRNGLLRLLLYVRVGRVEDETLTGCVPVVPDVLEV